MERPRTLHPVDPETEAPGPNPGASEAVDAARALIPDVPAELIVQYLAHVDAAAGTRHLAEATAMAQQHVLVEARAGDARELARLRALVEGTETGRNDP